MTSSAPRPGWPLFLLAAAVFAADQSTKYAVEKLASPGSNHEVIPCCLNLVRTNNPGVAFGMLSESQNSMRGPMLIFFSLAVIGLIVWLMATSRAGGWFGQCGTTLILGGAAGNLADRIMRHSVVDFIDFHVGNYHWYTFNLADSAIVIGAGLVILELLRDLRHPTHERA